MDPDTARLRPGLRNRARQLRTLPIVLEPNVAEHIGDGTASKLRRVVIDTRGEGMPARNRRQAA